MNRVLEPFEALMKGLRAGMEKEGLTFAEMMAMRELMAVEKKLLGSVVDMDNTKALEREPARLRHDEPNDEKGYHVEKGNYNG